MAFIPYNAGTGTDHSVIETILLYNSLTFAVGEVVETYTYGTATHATASLPIAGVIVGFVDGAGKPISPTGYVAGTATGTDVTSVTTSATNTSTTKQYYALVESSRFKKWSAQVNGTINTTATSGVRGCWCDVDSATTNWARVLESTCTRTSTNLRNFYSYGPDPSDSTRLIVSIAYPENSKAN